MLDLPFLYVNDTAKRPIRAVIVLPEIFGMTSAIRETVDRFAMQFGALAVGLEFFYPLTGMINELPYETGGQTGFEWMHRLDAETFLNLLDQTVAQIQLKYPEIREIVICGFCFGGKLAYLAGVNKSVKRIISFYGSNSLKPFYGREGVVQAVAMLRRGDGGLKILGLFGEEDGSIPEEDRLEIARIFSEHGINYDSAVFAGTGHAFFNFHRGTFRQAAAQTAWQKIESFLE